MCEPVKKVSTDCKTQIGLVGLVTCICLLGHISSFVCASKVAPVGKSWVSDVGVVMSVVNTFFVCVFLCLILDFMKE